MIILSRSIHSSKQFIMRSKFQLILLSGFSALLFSACAEKKAASVDIEKLKPEIQAMEDAYAAAEKAKDAAAVVVYYSDDAVSYNRNEEPTSGKAAARSALPQPPNTSQKVPINSAKYFFIV